MDIRALDDTALADDALMREFYDLTRRAETLGREQCRSGPSRSSSAPTARSTAASDMELFAAYDGDRMIANATLWTLLLDNTDKAFFELSVDVPSRRRGIGSAMVAHLEQLVMDTGRPLVMSTSNLPVRRPRRPSVPDGSRSRAATSSRCARSSGTSSCRCPTHRIQEWIDDAAPRHDGYSIETFVGAVPDDLVESLCTLIGQLAVDAPTGVVDFEEEVITPQRYAEMVDSAAAMGRARYETVALTPDREVVAQSTLAMPLGTSTHVYQWGTFVHREHRGHRLGLATKAVNLRAVQSARGDLTLVSTQNAEANDYMVAINDKMGFHPIEVSAEFVKRL